MKSKRSIWGEKVVETAREAVPRWRTLASALVLLGATGCLEEDPPELPAEDSRAKENRRETEAPRQPRPEETFVAWIAQTHLQKIDGQPAADVEFVDALNKLQTRTSRPTAKLLRLVGGRDALLKVDVEDNGADNPEQLEVCLVRDPNTPDERIVWTDFAPAPDTFPTAVSSDPATVDHDLEQSFKTVIPASKLEPCVDDDECYEVQISLKDSNGEHEHDFPVNVGAPTVLPGTVFHWNLFAENSDPVVDPSALGLQEELQQKLPVKRVELQEIHSAFPRVAVLPRTVDANQYRAVVVDSEADYDRKLGCGSGPLCDATGLNTATLLQEWNSALLEAGGMVSRQLIHGTYNGTAPGAVTDLLTPPSSNTEMNSGCRRSSDNAANRACTWYMNRNLVVEEWNGDYPWVGAMFGIDGPIADAVPRPHLGPSWLYFAPDSSSPDSFGEVHRPYDRVANEYFRGALELAGRRDVSGLAHDYSDFEMRVAQENLEERLKVWSQDPQLNGQWSRWNRSDAGYTSDQEDKNGYTAPFAGVDFVGGGVQDVKSVLVAVGGVDSAANLVYEPITEVHKSGLLQASDPTIPSQREDWAPYCPTGGCDYTLRVTARREFDGGGGGGFVRQYMLRASDDSEEDADACSTEATEALKHVAVNFLPSTSFIRIELLATPDAQLNGFSGTPEVLATWPYDCDTTCELGERCEEGPESELLDGQCVPVAQLLTDADNCGECGASCTDEAPANGVDATCWDAKCSFSCASEPLVTIDFTTNNMHCGGCDMPCGSGEACQACAESDDDCSVAECIIECSSEDDILCGTECVNAQGNDFHCGDCDIVCDTENDESCLDVLGDGFWECLTPEESGCDEEGFELCDAGICADTNSDRRHCGQCGRECDAECEDGQCVECTDDSECPGGFCVDGRCGECTQDADCAVDGNVCIAARCTDPATDCAQAECDTENYWCGNDPDEPGVFWAAKKANGNPQYAAKLSCSEVCEGAFASESYLTCGFSYECGAGEAPFLPGEMLDNNTTAEQYNKFSEIMQAIGVDGATSSEECQPDWSGGQYCGNGLHPSPGAYSFSQRAANHKDGEARRICYFPTFENSDGPPFAAQLSCDSRPWDEDAGEGQFDANCNNRASTTRKYGYYTNMCRCAATPSPCAEGETLCGRECVDAESDPLHCGESCTPCDADEICESGECKRCPEGTTLCDVDWNGDPNDDNGQACMDTSNNPDNCGGCGISCGEQEVCYDADPNDETAPECVNPVCEPEVSDDVPRPVACMDGYTCAQDPVNDRLVWVTKKGKRKSCNFVCNQGLEDNCGHYGCSPVPEGGMYHNPPELIAKARGAYCIDQPGCHRVVEGADNKGFNVDFYGISMHPINGGSAYACRSPVTNPDTGEDFPLECVQGPSLGNCPTWDATLRKTMYPGTNPVCPCYLAEEPDAADPDKLAGVPGDVCEWECTDGEGPFNTSKTRWNPAWFEPADDLGPPPEGVPFHLDPVGGYADTSCLAGVNRWRFKACHYGWPECPPQGLPPMVETTACHQCVNSQAEHAVITSDAHPPGAFGRCTFGIGSSGEGSNSSCAGLIDYFVKTEGPGADPFAADPKACTGHCGPILAAGCQEFSWGRSSGVIDSEPVPGCEYNEDCFMPDSTWVDGCDPCEDPNTGGRLDHCFKDCIDDDGNLTEACEEDNVCIGDPSSHYYRLNWRHSDKRKNNPLAEPPFVNKCEAHCAQADGSLGNEDCFTVDDSSSLTCDVGAESAPGPTVAECTQMSCEPVP